MAAPSNRGGSGAAGPSAVVRSTDRIEIRGLRALGICGVLPDEQVRPQPLEVALDIDANLAPAGASDDLDDTIDYAAIIEAVEKVITRERFQLLERLASRIADVVLSDERVSAVEVVVRKLRPPVAQQVETTGVRIVRGR